MLEFGYPKFGMYSAGFRKWKKEIEEKGGRIWGKGRCSGSELSIKERNWKIAAKC